MFRKKSFFILILQLSIFCLIFCCCSKEKEEPEPPKPDNVILTDGETLHVASEGGDVMLRFVSNKPWKIDIPATSEHFNGVLETREGEAGEVSIPFSALPNTSDLARSTTLRITAGRAEAEITVKQDPVEIELPSEEEVRAYLIRLFNETEGQNWRFKGKWCSDLPLNQWGSEVKYENGKLSLILGEHNLKGKINLSGCKALVSIRCSKNEITSLDVSDCPLLREIDCTNTGLEEVNVKGCLSLEHMYVPYNNLRKVDIGWSRTITELDVSHCMLEELDLSECVSMTNLKCFSNNLNKLSVPHRYRLINCFCYENHIPALDLRNSPQLQVLNCGDNNLATLEVTGCPRLRWIYCYANNLSSLDISDQKASLVHYYCFSNRLGKIDVSGYRLLSELHCSDNGLTDLKFEGCKSLRWLYCSYNRLESLEFKELDFEIFERLDCSYNNLRSAEIASLPGLLRLWCQGNRIGGEIPSHFDRLLEFEYDHRYEYDEAAGTYTDRGYGWWYPGEPDIKPTSTK